MELTTHLQLVSGEKVEPIMPSWHAEGQL